MSVTVELIYHNRFVFSVMTNISGLLKIRILIVKVSQMAR